MLETITMITYPMKIVIYSETKSGECLCSYCLRIWHHVVESSKSLVSASVRQASAVIMSNTVSGKGHWGRQGVMQVDSVMTIKIAVTCGVPGSLCESYCSRTIPTW